MLNSDVYASIVEACGDKNSIAVANATLSLLEHDLSSLRGTIAALVELTGCSSISPVFRRLFFGSTCTESVEGLASLYISLLCISTLGFIILSTRAALFNPVIRGRRSKRREKEFADYKVFMSKFYDTRNWELDWIPDVGAENHVDTDEQNEQCHSDETRSTSTVSPSNSHETRDDDDDRTIDKQSNVSASEIPQIQPAAACSEDNDDDSYDSTYSVDEIAVDDLRSTSTGSMFSLAYLKKRIESMKGLGTLSKTESHDEIVSSFSSTSVLSNFVRRRRGNANKHNGDALGLYPPSHNGGDWDQSDDENDSTDGVLMTPPAMRYSKHSQRSQLFRRGEDDPPKDSEMEPLSPPEQPTDSGCFPCENQETESTNNFARTFRRSSVYR
jgi:hypothetical protein